MTTPIGTSLQNGKYTLEQELGQGGFGVTYIATHHVLGHAVVIKTLNDSLRQDPNFWEFHAQFKEEARRLAKFSHPHIVRVSDFFIENELPYIVMDFIPGQTLKTLVIPNRPLPEAVALHYIRQVGAALSVVHQHGLLHRDVKPQNIILRQGTQDVVLIDFGISREFTLGMTQTHTGVLSAGYAPIEQYLPRAKRTPATDVYGLAATLYSLLTAEVPIASMLRHRQPLPAPRDLRPELSPMVNQAVLHGMALEPEQRPASVEAWLALLPDQPGVALPHTGNIPATNAPTLALVPPPTPQPPPYSPPPQPAYQPPSEWETAYSSQQIGSAQGAGHNVAQPVVASYQSGQAISSNHRPHQQPPSVSQRIGSNPLFIAGLTALGVLIPIALSTALLKPPSDPSADPASEQPSEPAFDQPFEPIQSQDGLPTTSDLDTTLEPTSELEEPSPTPEETPSLDSETSETTSSPESTPIEPSSTDSPQPIDTAPPVEPTPLQPPVEPSPSESIDGIEEPPESEEYIPEEQENLEEQNDRGNGNNDDDRGRGNGRDRGRDRGRDKDKEKDD